MKSVLLAVVAMLAALPASAGELCLATSSNGLNVTVDCSVGLAPTNAVGFSTESPPCEVGTGMSWCYVDSPSTPAFVWTISSSVTDATQTTGLIGTGDTDLYLWLFCAFGGSGMSAAEFALEGDLEVVSFTPLNGVLNAGTATELRLAVGGCPQGPIPAGIVTVRQTPVGVEGLVGEANWGRVKAGYR